MATIKEIAEKLDVSISTVSKGLNGASDISAKTRQMVLDTALEMGYTGKKGKNLFGKRICAVIVQLPYSNFNESGYEIISSFRLAAAEKNYQASVISLDELKKAGSTYDKAMASLGYEGAFFIGLTDHHAYIKQFQSTHIPTVLFEKYVHNPMVSMICTDITEGIYQCVEHLYQLGHRTIAFINGTENGMSSSLRRHGYEQALQDLNLPYHPELTASAPYYPPDKAKTYVAEFLKSGVTGIVCANDYIAAAVISEAALLGKRIPEDLSITGFDDIPLASYLNPGLTTINENRQKLGHSALKTLDGLIQGDNLSVCMIHPTLIHRSSTGPVSSQSSIF